MAPISMPTSKAASSMPTAHGDVIQPNAAATTPTEMVASSARVIAHATSPSASSVTVTGAVSVVS